jgi:hypothetical protein
MHHMFELATGSIVISLIAAAVSVMSLAFAMYSWRQANRPLVSARISTASGGSDAIALNIIVENTGNRPARDVQLIASPKDVSAALAPEWKNGIPPDAQRCLLEDLSIPVLANGRSTSNAFGYLAGTKGPWRSGAEIPIRIKYRDLGLRRFRSKLRLLLADDAGFSQSFWVDSDRQNSRKSKR